MVRFISLVLMALGIWVIIRLYRPCSTGHTFGTARQMLERESDFNLHATVLRKSRLVGFNKRAEWMTEWMTECSRASVISDSWSYDTPCCKASAVRLLLSHLVHLCLGPRGHSCPPHSSLYLCVLASSLELSEPKINMNSLSEWFIKELFELFFFFFFLAP